MWILDSNSKLKFALLPPSDRFNKWNFQLKLSEFEVNPEINIQSIYIFNEFAWILTIDGDLYRASDVTEATPRGCSQLKRVYITALEEEVVIEPIVSIFTAFPDVI